MNRLSTKGNSMRTKMGLVGLAFAGLLMGCSDPDVAPSFRLRNGTPNKASVQVKTTGGNTININVDPGVTSPYQESSVGRIDITASVQGDTGSIVGTFNAFKNEKYTVNINVPSSVTIESP